MRSSSESPRLTTGDLIAIAACLIIALLFFWKLAFTRLIFPRGDIFTYFYPYWQYRNEVMRTGQIPLWNPYIFMGTPFMANSQPGVFYPLNWITIPFDAPAAIKLSATLHICFATLGTYLLARRIFKTSLLGSGLAALLFALGGYLTAQVEHINQLQGLSWLPWLFWFWHEQKAGHKRMLYWLAIGFAMQLLAGHTQTAFISGVGLGLWAVWETVGRWREQQKTGGEKESHWNLFKRYTVPPGILALASLLALGLSAVQLLPTLELASLSNRGSGLPFLDAVSFSLKPHVIGRSLLPSYSSVPLFSEYVAHIGIGGLMLALFGGWNRRHEWRILGLGVLGGIGGFLALGAYNPVYWGLVRFAPGFDLFRAPARWLVLWALSASLCAGIGFDSLLANQKKQLRDILWPGAIILLLIGWSFLAPLSRDEVPGATSPAVSELLIWIITLLAATGLLRAIQQGKIPARYQPHLPAALAALVMIELFIGTRNQPYNDLSDPAAWDSQRPAISTLLAGESASLPPARYLSISDTFFDPGDLPEINAIYGQHLGEDALFDYIVATKQKEILAPNLSMAWGLPSMDGFDGGILPTQDYIRFTGLFLESETVPPDGRLREYLDTVPDPAWLRLSGVRWIITDKVRDSWQEGVYYDLQYTLTSTGDNPQPVQAIPVLPFESTTVGIVGYVEFDGDTPPGGTQIGSVVIYTPDYDLPLVQPLIVGEDFTGSSPDQAVLAVIIWDSPVLIERVEVSAVSGFPGSLTVQGVSLIDDRTLAFMPTTLSRNGDIRLVHSGDVKIYEYSGTYPRAYLVCNPLIVEDQEAAWQTLAETGGQEVVIVDTEDHPAADCDPADPGVVEFIEYAPEKMALSMTAKGEGVYLVISDAWYPGWFAQFVQNGEAKYLPPILRANGLFRAVYVPPGDYELFFEYHNRPFWWGIIISLECWLIVLIGLTLRWKNPED